jgi:glycosyltransferase involved in cell wall biosynthesis
MRDTLIRFGAPAERVHLLPYGINGEKVVRLPRSEHPGLRLGFFGHAEPIKGLSVLVQALEGLPGLHADLLVWVFSKPATGTFLDGLPAAIRERLVFKGTVCGAEVGRAICQCDAVVVPSVWHENAPYVVLEAMANGVPVLASDVEGVAFLLDSPPRAGQITPEGPGIRARRHGVLVERGNPDAWQRLFIQLRAKPVILAQMAEALEYRPRTQDFADALDRLARNCSPATLPTGQPAPIHWSENGTVAGPPTDVDLRFLAFLRSYAQALDSRILEKAA